MVADEKAQLIRLSAGVILLFDGLPKTATKYIQKVEHIRVYLSILVMCGGLNSEIRGQRRLRLKDPILCP